MHPLTLRRRTFATLALLSLSASLQPLAAAAADAYPSKPITLVVPFAPGGNLDTVARTLGPALGKALGQTVLIDNKAGAGGAIGAAAVARADADGHTLLVTTPNAVAVLPHMLKTPYQLSAFQAVGQVTQTTLAVVVRQASPYKDLQALLADARSKPGRVTVGHAGPGTTSHLAAQQLETAAQVDLSTVPYKGSGPALTDLMGGQIDAVVDQLTSSSPHIQSGALRVLAVMSRDRDATLPQAPTVRESGLADFEATTATGLLAPAATPRAIVDTLQAALRKALDDPAVKARLVQLGSPARLSNAESWRATLALEDSRAAALAKAGKLKAD